MMTTGNPIPAERRRSSAWWTRSSGRPARSATRHSRSKVGKTLPRIRDSKREARRRPQGVLRAGARAGGEGIERLSGAAPHRRSARKRPPRALRRGPQIERANFDKLVTGPESKALRHMFFAERQTSKIPDVPEDTPVREIDSGRGRRRRHHGRRHRHELRQRRHPGHDRRHHSGSARAGLDRKCETTMPPRSPRGGSRRPTWTSAWALIRGSTNLERRRRRRHRHRGGVRAHGREAGDLPQARRHA